MKLKQIGNGGAFNTKDCNSSFLIQMSDGLMLFDCGYSVFPKLIELDSKKVISLKDLKYVYISHLDDDHVGSVKSLIYYQYFMNKMTMKIVFDDGIYKDLNNYIQFDNMNHKTIKEYYKYITPEQLLIEPIRIKRNKLILENGIKLETFFGDHHKDCYGLKITENGKSFAITGDTVATKNIEEACFDCKFVFHDFSFWNEPGKQVHACEDNIKATYSEQFIKKLKFYHNNEKYFKGWLNI